MIPYYQPLRMFDYDIATGLAYRQPVRPPQGHCLWCGDKADLGDDEICLVQLRATIGRHDAVVWVIGKHLSSDHSTKVDVEPHTHEGRRRNDIRWHGAPNHGRGTIDFDIKVVSLLDSKSHLTTTRLPANTKLATHATQQSLKFLDSHGSKATVDSPLASNTFKPLVFSTGGLMSKGTADEVLSWKSVLGETVFGRLGSAISIELVKARDAHVAC
jgi:hypothetical protein